MTTALLADTCAVLWLFGDGALRDPGRGAVEAALTGDGLLVSAVSAWEIGQLAAPSRRHPLVLTMTPADWFAAILRAPGVRAVDLAWEVAVLSAHLPGPIHRDPADRLLIATARAMGVAIVTRDRAILDYAAEGHVRAVAC